MKCLLVFPLCLLGGLLLAGCENSSSSDTPSTPGASLPPPALIHPLPGTVLTNPPPRTLTFAWLPVEGAASYSVQVEMAQPDWDLVTIQNVATNALTLTLASTNQARWRVWALDANETPGQVTGWVTFRFAE